jgi:hypothetical protein
MKIGDTVIWRQGKSKSKTCLPLGIANCKVVDFGEGPSGEKAVSIRLPEGWPAIDGLVPGEPFWVLAGDLEE